MDVKIWAALIAFASAALTSALALYGARAQARRDYVSKDQLADKDFVAKSDLADKEFIANSGLTILEDELRREAEQRQQELESETVLARYRDPLIHATFFLQQRLFQILRRDSKEFGPYLRAGSRRDLAIKSTLYRLSEYLAWTEILRREVQFMNLTEETDTRMVQRLIGQVSRTLATDQEGFGTDFMLWVEEQRAIAELMIVRGDAISRCIGFAAFIEDYDPKYARWLDEFAAKLPDPDFPRGRLTELFNLLLELGNALDPQNRRYDWRDWQQETDGRMVGKLE